MVSTSYFVIILCHVKDNSLGHTSLERKSGLKVIISLLLYRSASGTTLLKSDTNHFLLKNRQTMWFLRCLRNCHFPSGPCGSKFSHSVVLLVFSFKSYFLRSLLEVFSSRSNPVCWALVFSLKNGHFLCTSHHDHFP